MPEDIVPIQPTFGGQVYNADLFGNVIRRMLVQSDLERQKIERDRERLTQSNAMLTKQIAAQHRRTQAHLESLQKSYHKIQELHAEAAGTCLQIQEEFTAIANTVQRIHDLGGSAEHRIL
ncbi:uncharacterized protein B0H18DRAFT_1116287 [Fomitopsis serialis]|uniref:uncharacterized protein n=1 Tax=Fomitopsis serialis TaxID=139415 RepID=UPI002007EC27|nr:uncharacterized protein B0H18DRAFT_1116287 [Neoantrodia serialis]KAH9931484.1 hypothetical protein B0H18DRAFT_1116287 [Neoantrodia serialis]